MRSKYYIICLLCFTLSCTPKNEEEIYPKNMKIVDKNQSYGAHPRNVMDIFLTKDRIEDIPTIIFIHGGGWVSGDKSDFEPLCSIFADSSVNAVTMNYRYADSKNGITCDDLMEDVSNVISFLKKNHKKYGCKFNNITLFGISAGGHMSLLYAYKYGGIKNVISMAGPTDFNDNEILSMEAMKWALDNLLAENNEQNRREASPITYAHNADKINTLLYHGLDDNVLPYSQSEKLFSVISSLNTNNKLTLFPNCGHGFNDEANYKVVEETLRLIKK